MRRFNPGRPCCRVCPEECFIPFYRESPWSDFSIQGASSIHRWENIPTYSGQFYPGGFIGQHESVGRYLNIIPSASAPIAYDMMTYENNTFPVESANFPIDTSVPNSINRPVSELRFRFNGPVSFSGVNIGINSFDGPCRMTIADNSRSRGLFIDYRMETSLYLYSEEGTSCGERKFIYRADHERTIYDNPPDCSGIQVGFGPYIELEINVDESIIMSGVIPVSGTYINYAGGSNGIYTPAALNISNNQFLSYFGNQLPGHPTGVALQEKVFYNNTASPPDKKSKLWVSIISSGVPYTGYYECGRASGSVIQANYYRGTGYGNGNLYWGDNQIIPFPNVLTENVRNNIPKGCSSTIIDQISNSSVDPYIQYSNEKGVWRCVDSWQGTRNDVQVSGVPNVGSFIWKDACPVFYNLYTSTGRRTVQTYISAPPPYICAVSYTNAYPTLTNMLREPGRLIAVRIEGIQGSVAERYNGTYQIRPFSYSRFTCNSSYGFQGVFETYVICRLRAYAGSSNAISQVAYLSGGYSISLDSEGRVNFTLRVAVSGPGGIGGSALSADQSEMTDCDSWDDYRDCIADKATEVFYQRLLNYDFCGSVEGTSNGPGTITIE